MRSLLAIALSVVTLVPRSALCQQAQWTIGGAAIREYTIEDAAGSVTDPGGARLTLRSTVAAPAGFGAGSTTLPADPYRRARVRLRGQVRAHNVVGGGGSIWLRVDGASGLLLLDNGTEQAIRGDSGWVTQEITLPVPRSAAKLVFGALLRGTGAFEVRGLRLDTLVAATGGEPSGMAKTVIDSAVSLARTQSMWRDTVSWNVVVPDVRELTRGATTSADVYPAIRTLLASLGDHHSFFMPPRQTTQFRTGGAENPRAAVRVLDGGFGYISVPAYGGVEQQAARDYARAVHDSMLTTMPRASCGWIVDLRGNGGGNMYPMLNGLKPFLGNDTLGAFVGPGGTRTNWVAPATQPPPPALAPLESAYVAVLTGPRTGSSGEAVTISFRGRARTRSFGAPTAGLSTANGTFPLPDGSMIVLTTAVEADRTGRMYGAKVDPDEVVGGANAAAAESDSTVTAASRWLRQETRCGR